MLSSTKTTFINSLILETVILSEIDRFNPYFLLTKQLSPLFAIDPIAEYKTLLIRSLLVNILSSNFWTFVDPSDQNPYFNVSPLANAPCIYP